MKKLDIFFEDYFDLGENVLKDYGALNICLTFDLPLYIDPFLLFSSEKAEYKKLHDQVISHLVYLKDIANVMDENDINMGLFTFPEIKENWLGVSLIGNAGRGLGKKFAINAIKTFKGIHRNFGSETITSSSHIEKITLMNKGIGKDFISDFTTNLIGA